MDAHAYIHRAYHALPPLTGPAGEPVGALYGFARMLLNLVKKEKPDLIAVCFDTPEPTFRHKLSEKYKATRKEIDGDLRAQLSRAQEMAQAMGFSCVAMPGYEADDVMATLAQRGAAEGIDAVLVTGDKDALQMVKPGIRVFNIAKNIWMDAPEIEGKFGVPPTAIVDYLAIIGDSSDNVSGIKGIGPVGAVKLIKKYGSLQGAIKAAKSGDPEIAPKVARSLLENEKAAYEAVALIELKLDVPVGVRPSDCGLAKPDAEKLGTVFGRLGFNSLLHEMLPGQGSAEEVAVAGASMAQAPSDLSPGSSLREVALKEILKDLAKADVLTVAGLPNKDQNLVETAKAFLALGLPDGRTAVCRDEELKNKAVADLVRGSALKVGYDLKETAASLKLLGLELAGPYFDTMLAAYVLNPGAPKADGSSGKEWRAALLRRAACGLGHEGMKNRMKETGVLKCYEELELPLIEILGAMEEEGVAVDGAYLSRLSVEFEADIEKLKGTLDEMAGAPINVNSSKQLGELLYDKLGLPVAHKTAKGGRSTDEEALKTLAASSPIPAKVLEYRELTKLKSNYIDGLLNRINGKTGRVHTHFDQAGAATGRLSSLDPNLQNIPIRSVLGQKIRRAFVAKPGCVLLSADYSQIDLRVLAHVSGDPVLKEAFEKDEDVHTRTAAEMFQVPVGSVDKEMRRGAKAINFGIVYGQTAHGLSESLGISYGQAADYIKKYFERYAGVALWIKKNVEQARKDGFVRTLSGRIRYLADLGAKNTQLRQFAERAAGNTPIQGGSADVIKYAMLRVNKELSREGKFKARMLLQIHDELLFEVPRAELKKFVPWVKEAMEGAVFLDVPLRVDLKAGDNWQDMTAVPL